MTRKLNNFSTVSSSVIESKLLLILKFCGLVSKYTVQISFSLFVSPVFGLNNIVAYADDTYTITSSRTKESAVVELGKALTTISLWFKSSGLKVNEGKTEITIFYKNN